MVGSDRLGQLGAEGYAAEEFRVRLRAIEAAVGRGNHDGDHFVLLPSQG